MCMTLPTTAAIIVYNDLPSNFNYLEFQRNDTSFLFDNSSTIATLNDADDLLKNALSAAYPEYTYS